jgi:hypothetical protein
MAARRRPVAYLDHPARRIGEESVVNHVSIGLRRSAKILQKLFRPCSFPRRRAVVNHRRMISVSHVRPDSAFARLRRFPIRHFDRYIVRTPPDWLCFVNTARALDRPLLVKPGRSEEMGSDFRIRTSASFCKTAIRAQCPRAITTSQQIFPSSKPLKPHPFPAYSPSPSPGIRPTIAHNKAGRSTPAIMIFDNRI